MKTSVTIQKQINCATESEDKQFWRRCTNTLVASISAKYKRLECKRFVNASKLNVKIKRFHKL